MVSEPLLRIIFFMCNLQSCLPSVLRYLRRRRHCQNRHRHRRYTLKTTAIPVAAINSGPIL